MSTYELYLGGPRQQNSDFAQFPSAPFSANNPALPSLDQLPVTFAPARVFDFTGKDRSLDHFVKDTLAATPLASGDVLGAEVIPERSLLFGFHWWVYAPLSGGSFSLTLRNAAVTYLTAQSTGTVSSGWVPITGAADLLPTYLTAPDILDVTLDTVPADGVQGLVLIVQPCYMNFRAPFPAPVIIP